MTGTMSVQSWRNWSGNQRAVASSVEHPVDAAAVAAALRSAAEAGQTVKPVGSGHSFTATALTAGARLDLSRLTGVVAVDAAQRLVRVRAGTTIRALNAALAAAGLAMPNLGDIDAQTISGALATGTHGTGAGYGCLSTFVEALELVSGAGDVVRCSPTEQPDLFEAARVGVGAVGVVTEVTLRCADSFILAADERPAPLNQVLSTLDELVATNEHFEFFWMPYTTKTLTKANNRVDADTSPRTKFSAWLNDDLLENT